MMGKKKNKTHWYDKTVWLNVRQTIYYAILKYGYMEIGNAMYASENQTYCKKQPRTKNETTTTTTTTSKLTNEWKKKWFKGEQHALALNGPHSLQYWNFVYTVQAGNTHTNTHTHTHAHIIIHKHTSASSLYFDVASNTRSKLSDRYETKWNETHNIPNEITT